MSGIKPRTKGGCAPGFADALFAETERIRRKADKTRNAARQGVFAYIELFYDLNRRHVDNEMLPPVKFRWQQSEVTRGLAKPAAQSRALELPD